MRAILLIAGTDRRLHRASLPRRFASPAEVDCGLRELLAFNQLQSRGRCRDVWLSAVAIITDCELQNDDAWLFCCLLHAKHSCHSHIITTTTTSSIAATAASVLYNHATAAAACTRSWAASRNLSTTRHPIIS